MEYKCSVCNASGCKLWRQYNTFTDYIKLLCAQCGAKDQSVDISDMTVDGKVSWYCGNKRMGVSDQLGNLMPAVPTEDGSTFWGYSSAPEELCKWWKELPNG